MEKQIYSKDAKKLVEENLKRGMSITDSVKDVCLDLGIEYNDNYRKHHSRLINKARKNEDHTALISECENVGIPLEKVNHYWYKGKQFSIHVKGDDNGIDLEDLVEQATERMKAHSPKYKSFTRASDNDGNLLVIDCADIHIGKLASAYVSGEEYNIEIAKERVREGFCGIMTKASNFNISKVLLVIGNDVLHVDNAKSTTTSGTFQDSSDMLTTMFNEALGLYVSIIDTLIPEYDVDVVFNSSNHDYITGWMLARCLDAWYRNSKNVQIDSGIIHRKYYQYGQNMICTSHGDGCKMQDLPLLMANEAPSIWASTKYRYAYLHHIHHKQVNKFQSGKDYIGVTVEYLRSPSSSDSWHHRNGYTGAKKAVEGFIHSYDNGQIARITHYFI